MSSLGLLLILVTSAAAQSRDDGSVYSRFGLGELRSFSSSQTQAMGGGGTAMWSYNYTNFDNPATWSRQLLVRAAVGMRFDRIRSEDAASQIENLTAGSLSAVQFGLPIKPNVLGIGLSYAPFTRTNYRISTQRTLITDPVYGDTTSYWIDYEGSGGLQRARIGLGLRPFAGVSIGAATDFIFGITEEARRTTFQAENFAQTYLASSTRMFGWTASFGVIVHKTNLLTEQDDLSIAARLRLPAVLKGNRARTLGESLNRDTLGTQLRGDVRIPMSARFGAAYYLQNRWVFTLDGLYEPWTQFESDLSLPGYIPNTINNMRNRRRISGGLEFRPAGASLLDSYLRRVAYRLGFYYDGGYVSPAQDVNISTLAVTGGVSLPALLPGTRLDVNFALGSRGSADRTLVQDQFVTLSATLNIGERWFVKRKLQ